MRLVLIGPRGCGKTSIGRMLAQRLACPFIDLDDCAAAQFDERSITNIWAKHGEAVWRNAELRALQELLSEPDSERRDQGLEVNQIIALGGGTPAIPEARETLLAEKARGLRIVYLKCHHEELAHRLSSDPGDRPSITGRGSVEEIANVLALREPIYEAIADAVIDASAKPEQVVEAVLNR